MAVDYIFVGSTFSFVLTVIFSLLGWESGFRDQRPQNVVYTFIGLLSSFFTGAILMSSGESMMEAFYWLFVFFTFLNLFFLIIFGVQGLRLRRKQKRGWD